MLDKSVRLQNMLEQNLKDSLPTGGLTMFIKGWSIKATPLGRLYCQLAVSVRPIKEIDCGLWPTPRCADAKNMNNSQEVCEKRHEQGRATVPEMVKALWATPNTMDHMSERSYEAMKRQATTGGRKGRTFPGNLREQVVPAMCEAYREAMIENGKTPAMWPTPTVRDHKDTGDLSKGMVRKDGKLRNDTLGRVAYGLNVLTESKGSLNPQFPCWLMGFSTESLSSMLLAMQSYRKPQQSSSKRPWNKTQNK